MFNDFEDGAQDADGKGRRAASLGVAAVLLIILGSGVAAALATVRVVQQQRDQDVTFEDLPLPPAPEVEEPPPPPPPPPPRRARRDRPAGQRPVLDGPPSGIPDERPEEAEGELGSAENVGPIENDAEMGEGGDGAPEVVEPPVVAEEAPRPAPRPPSQVRETIRRARYLADQSQCRRIIIPDDVAAALGAQTVRVRIRALVDPSGRVRNATVTEGHPLIPEDIFIACAEQWAFEPATLPDGTAVPYPAIRTFVIRPRT